MRRLMPDEAAFVACLLNSGTLDAALAAAYASDAAFDVLASLSPQIEDQVWIWVS